MEQQYLQNQTSETVPHFVSHPTPMPSSAIFHCDTSMEKFWENNNKKQTAKSLLMSVAATATAAKSLQLCPTLQSHRRQPTRLPRPRDSPGKNTGVGCHFLPQCMKVKVKSLSRVRLLATPWAAAHQAPPSMGLSRQEYWSGVPVPSLIYIYSPYFRQMW